MACKCGASTFEKHKDSVAARIMGAHVYTGPTWLTGNDPWYTEPVTPAATATGREGSR